MTNLTEQWKKGKLPDGFYWIEFQDGEITPTTFSNQHGFICCDVICDDEHIKQILAEMLSYKEYQKLLSDHLAKNEGVEINAELEAENTKLKERNDSLNNRDINLCRIANGIRDENFALKELLKECKGLFNRATVDGAEPNNAELIEILTKIDQVLGEE